jgi:hypothetical protein
MHLTGETQRPQLRRQFVVQIGVQAELARRVPSS